MIKSLSAAGLGNINGLPHLIELAAANGFSAVETTGRDLRAFVDLEGIAAVRTYLERHNIQLGAVTLPVEWRQDDAAFRNGLPDLLVEADLASQLGCQTFFTYFMPSTDNKITSHLIQLSQRLRLLGKLLAQYKMNLALEYVGPHHLRHQWKNPFIWTAADTIAWLDLVGEANVGIVLDSFHWYTSGETLQTIADIELSYIKYVHLNDARDIPVENVLDNDRVYPGEGVIPLTGFLKALKAKRYQGIVTQEILTITEPQDTAEQLAERSGKAFRHVFTAAEME